MSQRTDDRSESIQTRLPSNTQERQQDSETADEDERSRERSCPECESTDFIEDSGEIVCTGCGIVINDDQIDHGPDWRAFDAAERDEKSRVGAPMTKMLHDNGLSTQIGWKNQDGYGNQISGRKRKRLNRLRKWQERTRTKDASERNLKGALSEINRMAAGLGIPKDVQEVASVVYRRALNEDLIRGRSIEGVATGALYAACRQEGIARTLDEVTNVSRVEYREIARTYKYIAEQLGLEMAPTNPKEYLPRFASKLDLSHETQEKAAEILDAAIENDVHSGKSPPALAASALYAAGLLNSEKRTQDEVSDVAQVSNVTIRNQYKEQLDVMDISV